MNTLYVADSKIHGVGCFARVTLCPGIVFPCEFREIRNETWTSINHDGRVFELSKPFRFLNHSSTPNSVVYAAITGCDNFLLHILRRVESKEELTIDYGDEW